MSQALPADLLAAIGGRPTLLKMGSRCFRQQWLKSCLSPHASTQLHCCATCARGEQLWYIAKTTTHTFAQDVMPSITPKTSFLQGINVFHCLIRLFSLDSANTIPLSVTKVCASSVRSCCVHIASSSGLMLIRTTLVIASCRRLMASAWPWSTLQSLAKPWIHGARH